MKKYDFYYSKKYEDVLKKSSFTHNEKPITTVNGIVYTEMIEHGKEPITNNYGDLVLVAENESGSSAKISNLYY